MNDNKKSAYSMAKESIENDIVNLVALAKKATIEEAKFMLYCLHISRVKNMYLEKDSKGNTQLLKDASSVYEEVYKYLAQFILKYREKPHSSHSEPVFRFDTKLVNEILDKGKLLNTKFDSLELITLLGGNFQKDEGIILKPALKEKGRRFFEYFCRIERDSLLKAQDFQNSGDYISKFDNEYRQYKDLIEKHFEIKYTRFIEFYQYIINFVKGNYRVLENYMPRLENGNVDDRDYMSFKMVSSSSYISIEILERRFGKDIIKFINKLVFNPDEFDENKGLKYPEFSRKPLIKSGNKLYISPELILDSMFINSHYSLLRSSKKIKDFYKQKSGIKKIKDVHKQKFSIKEIKDVYQQKSSDCFVDDIANLALRYGYKEVEREVYLSEGKKEIGDIDLILKNQEGHYLLIEAKKHTLPLDVYFKDVKATEKRLDYLKNDWEKKVLKRTEHLNKHYSEYKIDKDFTYIIVSQNPEIISHFSDLMILSFLELEKWLEQKYNSFNELYKDLYKLNGYTEKEFEQLFEEKLTIFKTMPN